MVAEQDSARRLYANAPGAGFISSTDPERCGSRFFPTERLSYAQSLHPEHPVLRILENRQPGALFARDAGVDPELGDLLRAPSRRPAAVAGPLAAEGPGERCTRQVHCQLLGNPELDRQLTGAPGIMPRPGNRHLGCRRVRGAPAGGRRKKNNFFSAGGDGGAPPRQVERAAAPGEKLAELLDVSARGAVKIVPNDRLSLQTPTGCRKLTDESELA